MYEIEAPEYFYLLAIIPILVIGYVLWLIWKNAEKFY